LDLSEKTTNEIRYYISSLDANAGRFNELIRGHWAIENPLHWTLDMTFSEDRSRIRKGNADENFSTIRRIAINTLKLNKSKGSMKAKRTTAALSDQFREMLLKIY
jgi:predicted transposase YbfD/YdcC